MKETGAVGRRMMVYTGPGASNSWIWLADFLERSGFLDARFCPSWKELETLTETDLVMVPGGDTFQMAEHAGAEGLAGLKERISEGASYVGICAGAYLPLRSALHPLSQFNLVDAKIANISARLPSGMADGERYTVPYGCSLVYHPVRGNVRLAGDEALVAPLYGGPLLIPNDGEIVRLTFDAPASGAEILVDEGLLREVLAGRGACIEAIHGKGRLLLISPHLEHPEFPVANQYLVRLLRRLGCSDAHPSHLPEATERTRHLRRIIADLRVTATALEARSWKVGIKYWEGEKLLVFIDAVRRRLAAPEWRHGTGQPAALQETVEAFENALQVLRTYDASSICPADVRTAVDELSRGASEFLTLHFSLLRSAPDSDA